ncbi:uncharacterized protein EAF01_000745 [Botrytis porri]|uniref:Uncharacterized protein n=1 Tax=Botrytis porri TaxID=87229 RepID=A0A4Z1L4G0_9HELO|nr:uncharacterized protein EAF01_000745 [Botrytis porri]KAF7914339.1 hypothetical protein EAF01_000745 [Botrytis porri]TGO91577.1 hypothetical protein BPOR_0023g00020 [Botrytis porri]
MSPAGINGGGIGIENWLSNHRQPFRPFLRGNLEKAIRYRERFMMGSSYSSLKIITPPQKHEREILASDEEDDEDEDIRPIKRRKTTNTDLAPVSTHDSSSRSMSSTSTVASTMEPSSLNRSTTEESPPPRLPSKSQVNKIKPTDFYGLKKSRSDRARIDSVLKLTKTPVDFRKLLRIQVASIIQNSSLEDTDDGNTSQYSNIKCTLVLLRISEDGSSTDIYRQPQTGRIRMTSEGRQNDTFPVYLPPFIIPSEVLSQDPNSDDSFDQLKAPNELGKFGVQFIIEPFRANRRDWLPLTFSSLSHNSRLAKRIFKGESELTNVRQMRCEFQLFDWDSKRSTADIELLYDGEIIETSASLNLNIQWSLPSHLHKKEAHIEVPKLPTPVPELAPELSLAQILSPQKATTTTDPESPSRGQRRVRANVPTYNLKALSAKAQGKKLRAHWARETSETPFTGTDTGESVTYTVSKANAEAYNIKQMHVVAGLSCPICNLDTKSMESLRLHFKTTHFRFTFHVRPKSSFFIEINKDFQKSREIHPLQNIQFGQASTLLDMEKYLSGDNSWAEDREGPLNNQWPDSEILARLNFKTTSFPSPESSRQSSPETSNNDLETKEGEGSTPVPGCIKRLALPPTRTKDKHYVPDIKHGPYPRSAYAPEVQDREFNDYRTRRVLKPGDELPDTDDENDESYLLHKRKWIINDYTDVQDDEKEYFIKWEEFIMAERLTNQSHLPETITRFVARNRVWFAEKKARKKEWRKQIELWVARGDLKVGSLMSYCEKMFEQGKKELKEMNSKSNSESKSTSDAEPAEVEPMMRGPHDCVCGHQVSVWQSNAIQCSGRLCVDGDYHRECAEKSGRPVERGNWLCDRCHAKASGQQPLGESSNALTNYSQNRILQQRRNV